METETTEAYECDNCGELYDPEDTFNFDACVNDHCDNCRRDCPMCARHREFEPVAL